ncbi:MAG: MBL fold metallo-hydrolase [Ectothiorhodospiraceae bacterium]|nr:MBL fold metallo-hydrolase [Ectothiorhodospiraceae bacterium]MCH8503491.1 MBL fold metallo-hydrolase [Ectothiorhodospiraceae bacterium]
MRQVQADLWETEAEYPFPGLITRAYLLTRDEGNVLFYNTGHPHEIDAMAERGGVSYQFLSHQDELGETLNVIGTRFGAQLGGHVNEQEEFARIRRPELLFDKRETLLGNIEVIPTPGHSPGSVCFLVDSPHGKRYLFTGDTLFLNDDGGWQAGLISGYSDRDALIDSLKLLRGFRPDMVISSACPTGVGFQEMAPEDWPARVDDALSRVVEVA